MNSATACGIGALGSIRVPWPEIAGLRKNPAEPRLKPHIRMSDELTVLAVASVQNAIDQAGWNDRSFEDFGLLAGARYFGRVRFANNLQRWRKAQVHGQSPMTVPHLSLHAIAGTVSIAFRIHGPHFAISGNPGLIAEGLLMGMGMLHEMSLPGLWVVFSEWDLEPDAQTEPVDRVGQALAIALMPNSFNTPWVLQLQPGEDSCAEECRVADLIEGFHSDSPCEMACPVPGLGSFYFQPQMMPSLEPSEVLPGAVH